MCPHPSYQSYHPRRWRQQEQNPTGKRQRISNSPSSVKLSTHHGDQSLVCCCCSRRFYCKLFGTNCPCLLVTALVTSRPPHDYFEGAMEPLTTTLRPESLDHNHCSWNNSDSTLNPLPQNWCLDNNQVQGYMGERNGTTYNMGSLFCVKPMLGTNITNKTIVFVSDSGVRYQFMHLVSFLATTRWQMRCQDFLAIHNQSSLVSLDPKRYLINHQFQKKS